MGRSLLAVATAILALALVAGLALAVSPPLADVGAGSGEAEWRDVEADATFDIDPNEGMSDAEIEQVVDRAMVRVEELREVEFEERPEVFVLSRQEAAEHRGSLADGPSDDTRAFQNAKMGGLFFVDYETDAVTERTATSNASVGGYYEVGQNRIVVVYDGDTVIVDELVLAHELLHAWQDQAFGLDSFPTDTLDAGHARSGLIEGDAVFLETLYEERCETEWECLRPDPAAGDGDGGSGAQSTINWGIYFSAFQPYSDGPAFIQATYENGGWDAVNALYEDPPTTARHIIEPHTYGTFEPRAIELEDTHGGEWERLRSSEHHEHERLGQARIAAMFQQTWQLSWRSHEFPIDRAPANATMVGNWELDEDGQLTLPRIDPLNYDLEMVTGWEGDRFHAYENDGRTAWVWRIGWESPAEAATFVAAYEKLLVFFGAEEVHEDVYVIDTFGFDGAYAVSSDADEVALVYAPTILDLPLVSREVATAVGLEVYTDDPGHAPPAVDRGEPPDISSQSDDVAGDEIDSPDDDGDPTPGFGALASVLVLLVIAGFVRKRWNP